MTFGEDSAKAEEPRDAAVRMRSGFGRNAGQIGLSYGSAVARVWTGIGLKNGPSKGMTPASSLDLLREIIGSSCADLFQSWREE